MNEADSDALKPLAGLDGKAAFDEAWQAQALAIADSLVQSGLFSAGDWSATLGEALRQAENEGEVDDQETYYRCVLSALERLVADRSEIDLQAMAGKREDWEQAYLATPHGQPIFLQADGES